MQFQASAHTALVFVHLGSIDTAEARQPQTYLNSTPLYLQSFCIVCSGEKGDNCMTITFEVMEQFTHDTASENIITSGMRGGSCNTYLPNQSDLYANAT